MSKIVLLSFFFLLLLQWPLNKYYSLAYSSGYCCYVGWTLKAERLRAWSILMVKHWFILRPHFSLRITGLNVKQLLMAQPESSTSQASCKTGKQEEAEQRSSSHMVVRCRIESKLLSQTLSLQWYDPALLTC